MSTIEQDIDKMFSCSICLEKYKHRKDFKRHTEAKHEGVYYNCDKCEYISNRKDNMKRHLKKHSQPQKQKHVHVLQSEPEKKKEFMIICLIMNLMRKRVKKC